MSLPNVNLGTKHPMELSVSKWKSRVVFEFEPHYYYQNINFVPFEYRMVM